VPVASRLSGFRHQLLGSPGLQRKKEIFGGADISKPPTLNSKQIQLSIQLPGLKFGFYLLQ
jgi:hypothetical protein